MEEMEVGPEPNKKQSQAAKLWASTFATPLKSPIANPIWLVQCPFGNPLGSQNVILSTTNYNPVVW
jgi:hypothetical protein